MRNLAQFIFDGDEDERDFEVAWRLQRERHERRRNPRRCRTPAFLRYGEVGLLGRQLDGVFSVFPRSQVKCVVLDDLKKAPYDVYEDVLAFLALPSDGRANFPAVNENKTHHFRSLGLWLQNPPKAVLRTAHKVKARLGMERVPGLRALREMNSSKVQRPPLSDAFRAELGHHFQDDVEKLSGLVGRDLRYWLAS